MPELPEVELVRRQLAPSLVGRRIERVELRRPDLRVPFPPRFAARLKGRTVLALERRAKYLLAALSSHETLVMHLGMSGSFRIERKPRRAGGTQVVANLHDHVVFHLATGTAVVFNDPRRFGLMDLTSTDALDDHPALSGLGPEPLSPAFDAGTLAQSCRGRKISLKEALLDQHVAAGLGNIYASEALHLAGLSPLRKAAVLATPGGRPRESAARLTVAVKQVLHDAIAQQSAGVEREPLFLVYERQDEQCLKPGCRGTIRRRTQGGRSTYYCPVCQR